jgi:hypothetical protein
MTSKKLPTIFFFIIFRISTIQTIKFSKETKMIMKHAHGITHDPRLFVLKFTEENLLQAEMKMFQKVYLRRMILDM